MDEKADAAAVVFDQMTPEHQQLHFDHIPSKADAELLLTRGHYLHFVFYIL